MAGGINADEYEKRKSKILDGAWFKSWL
jgi:hypothetical protein